MKCQHRRCEGKYPVKFFIDAAYDRLFVCGYHARAWVNQVRVPLAEFAKRG